MSELTKEEERQMIADATQKFLDGGGEIDEQKPTKEAPKQAIRFVEGFNRSRNYERKFFDFKPKNDGNE